MILAGDIGGTKTFLALFDEEKKGTPAVHQAVFPSHHYPDLNGVLKEFLSRRPVSIQRAAFGVAGPVVQGRCETTNLPWIVDAAGLAREFEIASVVLLNDLEATAYGTLVLTENDFFVLNPGAATEKVSSETGTRGNRAIISAGTGLGEVVLFWNGSRHQPSASEGGHCDFAPCNPLQIALLEYLWKDYPTISYERILSGPGLFNIYRFLRDTGQGDEPPWLSERLAMEDPPAVISEVALAGGADLCVNALDLFVSVYGAEAGNLALKALATGGIYVGGGIAPKILQKLRDGTFMKAFVDKGRFSEMMTQIPVRIILNEKAALLGAAEYASSHR
ncbi:MAG: glucokinase [Nitrospirae bacterium]|nr:glucokinase [Candidatus Manganitrophaceae bacterium]